jgi:hypothetical protein
VFQRQAAQAIIPKKWLNIVEKQRDAPLKRSK